MKKILLVSVLIGLVWACKTNDDTAPATPTSPTTKTPTPTTPTPTKPLEIPDWTSESHSTDAKPNYAVVFPENMVNTLEIRMLKSDWDSIRIDMKAKFGFDFGTKLPAGGGGGMPAFSTLEPAYRAVSMKYNGKEWYKVGFRLKGNSSLNSAWGEGNYKLPFKLQFDEYEDQFPKIKDQRFYGFKEVSMSPAFKDNSLMRDKITPEVFRMAGIAAPKTAFYRIFIDFGDGLKYNGVYTMIEIPEDTMIKNQFGEESGNIYKPESNFTEGKFTQATFEKKNNETKADWSDITTLFASLHSKDRSTNPTQWRANLDKSLNTDYFLKWLAVNTVLQNWDTYGVMAHNHYLYNATGKGFMWIPWDNNEALSSNVRSLSLDQKATLSTWPLIRYLCDDPVYYAKYKAFILDFNKNVFTPEKMNPVFDKNYNLISSFVVGTDGEKTGATYLSNSNNFALALGILKTHVNNRNLAVKQTFE